MEHSRKRRIATALFLGWAILFFLYTLLGAWIGTGPTALAGPSTLNEDILAGLLVCLGIFQLTIAILANKRDTPWLFWVTAVTVVISVGMLALPLLTLLVSN